MRRLHAVCVAMLAAAAMASSFAAAGDMPDELRVKPEHVFEFAAKPTATRDGDRATVRFATKGYCDVTVAIEDGNGRILRHLASGVLGPNAPEPFQKNSHEQVITWDGKNDQGKYLAAGVQPVVRVSLGLMPRYDRSLFWDPKKRVSVGGAGAITTEDVIACPAPEGVYVYDGNGVDHLRLFDHDGRYLRTIYPFPADKIKDVKGLAWRDYPQGYARPQKNGLNETTFFTAGLGTNRKQFAVPAAFAMAVRDRRIALVKLCLSRVATDGSSGGLDLSGPRTWFNTDKGKAWNGDLSTDTRSCPYSAAFSPDGRRLYMAGFSNYSRGWGGRGTKSWLGGVTVMDYDGDATPTVFAGQMDRDSGLTPGVACDDRGRVYVTDFIRNCVDVFDADGKLLKSVPVSRPVFVSVAPKSGQLWVFSWNLNGAIWARNPGLKDQSQKVAARLTVIKSADDPRTVATYDLPWVIRNSGDAGWGDPTCGSDVRATVDFWADKPTVWLNPGGGAASRGYGEGDHEDFNFRNAWDRSNLLLLRPGDDGKLAVVGDFTRDIVRSVKRVQSNKGHQRLYVNPADGQLYETENQWWVGGGSFHTILRIDPQTGKVSEIELPVQWAEDMTFDIEGRIYLRQVEPAHRVLRYDPVTWREIPWDYGEEGLDKGVAIISGLALPSDPSGDYSQGGLYISPKGHLAVACATKAVALTPEQAKRKGPALIAGKKYEPQKYPGRNFVGLNGGCVHIWDEHGREVVRDAVPGMSGIDGLGLDAEDNVYLMSHIPRVYNGKPYFNKISGTLIKVPPGRNKWISDNERAPVPLPKDELPKRSPDIAGYTMGDVWIEGADWLYGGVGNCSFKIAPGCICWQQSRFTLDYFARSFAPETDQFSVAVLDSNGNLILRIGQYGNEDDGLPADGVPLGRPKGGGPMLAPPHPRSIGGDEVALMQPSHVATLTDRLLFIGDVGNARIVEVKLGYRTEEKITLPAGTRGQEE
ncbi:MAG: hypothetical protein BIFFINMI_02161 [Phycisphaerae bacterium]|nr:hypothetical protein [Phycisphaerae bacterium]